MDNIIKGSVVVITGASSGIGRQTAQHFAAEGARLVLAARDGRALDDVVRTCMEVGAEAVAVPTDVAEQAQVEALGEAAVRQFGRVDVWVNNAGAYMMGAVEDVPTEAYRRLMDVNFMGTVYGTRVALREFRRRGRGVIINVGSVAGKNAYALAAAYCASKHAVHGFTEALRQELVGTDIHACVVAPATVDTPLFEHAANYTHREIEAMRPIYPPAQVAEEIVSLAKRPQREVTVGAAPKVFSALHGIAPDLYEQMQPRMVNNEHLGKAPREDTPGNLFDAREPHLVEGGWQARKTGMVHLGELLRDGGRGRPH
ncbi:MAG: SDR family oxidoreductase [Polyangiales bacterium]